MAKIPANKKTATRKKSTVLKHAVKPSTADQLKSERNLAATLRANLTGFKLDLRDAKVSARAANKDVTIALRVISKQETAISKAAKRIDKLRAA